MVHGKEVRKIHAHLLALEWLHVFAYAGKILQRKGQANTA